MFHNCSKCDAAMEEGFLLEKGDLGALSAEAWVAGQPVKSLISGLSLKEKVVYTVTSFRCTACGYLESYAPSK